MLVRIVNGEGPDQQSSLGLSALYSLGLFGRHLVFKILKHLPLHQFKHVLEKDMSH